MYIPPDVQLNLEKASGLWLVTRDADERACGMDNKLALARSHMMAMVDRLLDEVIDFNKQPQDEESAA